MTQYMLSVHDDANDPVLEGEALQKVFAAVDVFNDKLQKDGVWVFAGGLQPAESATVVDGRGSEVLMVDGPFAGDEGTPRRVLDHRGPRPRRRAQVRRRGLEGLRRQGRGPPLPGRARVIVGRSRPDDA